MKILNLLLVVGLTFVILGVGLGVGAKVTGDIQAQVTGTAADAAANATVGIANLASWMPTIGTVSAAVVIIGLLLVGFGSFMGRGGEGGV